MYNKGCPNACYLVVRILRKKFAYTSVKHSCYVHIFMKKSFVWQRWLSISIVVVHTRATLRLYSLSTVHPYLAPASLCTSSNLYSVHCTSPLIFFSLCGKINYGDRKIPSVFHISIAANGIFPQKEIHYSICRIENGNLLSVTYLATGVFVWEVAPYS
jgi:hypothetical protein